MPPRSRGPLARTRDNTADARPGGFKPPGLLLFGLTVRTEAGVDGVHEDIQVGRTARGHPRRSLRPRRRSGRAASRRRGSAAHHPRRARAGRPRADRHRRRQPAHRVPRLRRLPVRARRISASPTAPCGRCPSRWPWTRRSAPLLRLGSEAALADALRPRLGRDPRRRRLRARPARGIARGLRDGRPDAPRRGLPPGPAAMARRRHRAGAAAARRPPLRALSSHPARAARGDRRPRMAARGRLPDPQPHPPRARAPHQGRAGGDGRPRAASPGGRDQG